MEIRAASLTAFYLYDVAEQIDLPALRATLGAGDSAWRAGSKPTFSS